MKYDRIITRNNKIRTYLVRKTNLITDKSDKHILKRYINIFI